MHCVKIEKKEVKFLIYSMIIYVENHEAVKTTTANKLVQSQDTKLIEKFNCISIYQHWTIGQ